MEIALLFIILFGCVLLGMPIGFSLAASTMVSFMLFTKTTVTQVAQYLTTGLDSFSMLAIPFFILAGIIMSKGGVARRLINVFMSFIGHYRGGLGIVMSVACCFFGAISGSATATTSAIGGVMIPEMTEKGYPPAFSSPLAAVAGIIGIIIPPSLAFVIYGVITNTSISDMFLAGIIPGIIITITLCAISTVIAYKKNIPTIPKQTWRQRGRAVWDAKWSLIAPVIILGGIYAGIFTPTESAVVAIVYSIIIGMFVYRELTWKDLVAAFEEATLLNCCFTFMLGVATAFSRYVTLQQIPTKIIEMITDFTSNPVVILLLINLFLLLVGCVVDTIPALTILAPIFLPLAQKCGLDNVQFGIIIVLNTCIGLVTPPYGPNLYLGNMIAKCKFEDSVRYLLPLFAGMLAVLALLTYAPWISTLLL